MEATTTIRKMLKDGHIFVPEYQRAYSWDTELGGGKAMHVNVFLSDLEQYVSLPPGAYYFGHFLFERTTGKTADGEESFASYHFSAPSEKAEGMKFPTVGRVRVKARL